MFIIKRNILIYLLICISFLFIEAKISISEISKPMEHKNGWIYPAGTNDSGGYAGWHGYPGHIGKDYYLKVGSPVYSMANYGQIIEYSSQVSGYGSSCGAKGGAILVKYKNNFGKDFYVLYGHVHLNDNLSKGSRLIKGQKIGTVHDYWGDNESGKCRYNWPHLHLGIHPVSKPLKWAQGVSIVNDNGWVDPVKYMDENSPVEDNDTVFDFVSNSMGWTIGNGIYNSSFINNQWGFNTLDDPYIYGPVFIDGIDTNQFSTIEISMSAGFEYGKQPQTGHIYYSANGKFSENNKIPIDEIQKVNFNGFTKIYKAKFDKSINLHQIRLDPIENGNFSLISLNYIRLVSNKSLWSFKDSSNGWSLQNANPYAIFNSCWSMKASSGDPQAISPWLGTINTKDYKSLHVKYAVWGNNKTLKANVYFDITDDRKGFNSQLVYTYDVIADGKMAIYKIPLPEINKCRKIYRIRVDFYEGENDEQYKIDFQDVMFSSKLAKSVNTDSFYTYSKFRKTTNIFNESHITIHEIQDMMIGVNTNINFKAYAFGCCSEKYKWSIVDNLLNLNIADDGTITGNTGNKTGEYKVIISACELYEEQSGFAEEEFIISVNDNPDLKAINIYNDGAETLEVIDIATKNGSNWIKEIDVTLPLNIDGGHFATIPISVDRRMLKNGEYKDSIIVTSNDSNDGTKVIPIELYVDKDIDAPLAPENIFSAPESWSSRNRFKIDWTNPDDPSEIVGAYYKAGNPPESNEDGQFIKEKPVIVDNPKEGKHKIYVWLKDGAGNINYKNLAYVDYYYDKTIPKVINKYPEDGLTNVDENTKIAVELFDEHSGINKDSVQLKVNDQKIDYDIEFNNKYTSISYLPEKPFGYEQNVNVSITASDMSLPQNQMPELSWSFKTLSDPEKITNVSFTAYPLTITTNESVAFTDQTQGNILSRLWDFGDGATDNTPNPIHTYKEPGTYTITLTIYGKSGESSISKQNYIIVSEHPKYLITGNIKYYGGNEGILIVDALSDSNSNTNIVLGTASYDWYLDDTSKSYTLNVLEFEKIRINAFIDIFSDDYNGIADISEPQGDYYTVFSNTDLQCDILLEELKVEFQGKVSYQGDSCGSIIVQIQKLKDAKEIASQILEWCPDMKNINFLFKLPAGIFKLVAFMDVNENGLYDNNEDLLTLPDPITITTVSYELSQPIIIPMQHNDKSGVAIDMDYETHDYEDVFSLKDIESSISASKNDELWVSVVAQQTNNLDTYQVEIIFDPDRLEFVSSAEENTFLNINNILKKNQGETIGFQALEKRSGNINISNSLVGSDCDKAPEGSGVLGLLKFKLLDDEPENSLTLKNTFFVNCNNDKQSITKLSHAAFNKCPQWDFFIDSDGIINYLDLSLFADHWLYTEDRKDWDSKFNLHTSPDEITGKQIINFMDLGVLADHWLEKSPCKK